MLSLSLTDVLRELRVLAAQIRLLLVQLGDLAHRTLHIGLILWLHTNKKRQTAKQGEIFDAIQISVDCQPAVHRADALSLSDF